RPEQHLCAGAAGKVGAHGADIRLDDGSVQSRAPYWRPHRTAEAVRGINLSHRSTFYHKSGDVSSIHDIPKLLDGMDPPASHRSRRHPKPIGYLLLRPLLHAVPSDQHLLRPFAKLAKSPVEIDALKKVVAHPRIRTPKMLALATLIADEPRAGLRQRAPRKVSFAGPLHAPKGELLVRHRLRRHHR